MSINRRADKLISFNATYGALLKLGEEVLRGYQTAKANMEHYEPNTTLCAYCNRVMQINSTTLNAYANVAARVFGVGVGAYMTAINKRAEKAGDDAKQA